ncbi:MAG: HAMP domain-containing protein [Chthoniobacterales bacterium]|nr:HAMP domain-containing protein [Chthoniobacterales bacterium]
MKNWPLRWKTALYAAVLGVVATIAGASTTWFVMRYSEVRALDRKMVADAAHIFHVLRSTRAEEAAAVQPQLASLATRDRLFELRDGGGRLLYRSSALGASALSDARTELHNQQIDGREFRVGTFAENGLTLRVAADKTDVNRLGLDIVLGMLAAIPTVLLVVVLGGRWVARQALGPVEAIRQAAAGITVSNLAQRLPMPAAHDEIGGLVSVLNTMLARLQGSFEQSIRFSADASHQLKTPITVLRAGIEEILTDPATPPKQGLRAQALLHQVHQLTSTAENLLLLARADAGRLELQRTEFDLVEVLDGLCDDTRALAEPNALTVETDLPAHLPVCADRASVALIAQNLVENSVKYNERGGAVRIAGRAIDDRVEVTVANNGDAIPAERASHIFDRFYRARGDGRIPGHGLGLSIARELAVAHGGAVSLVRSDGEWTEFRLTLPRA